MSKEETTEVKCTIPLDSGFTHILFNLASQGYSHIYVEYYGSGDSGAIEMISALKREDVIEEEDQFPEIIRNTVHHDIEDDLKDLIEKRVYENILNDATDWYNNEGGGGKLFISTDDCKFKADHYYNVNHEEHEDIDGTFGD